MADSDSMFLVELIVTDFRSYVKCKDFLIKSRFADVFSITLQYSKEIQKLITAKKLNDRKSKIRRHSTLSKKPVVNKILSGQSVIFTNNVENLVSYMKKYPMELSLWSTVNPKYKVASTYIPWSTLYIDYLNEVKTVKKIQSVSMTGQYNIFDEGTSRRMAVITLNIKLSFLSDRITTQFRALPEKSPSAFVYSGFNSKPSTVPSTVPKKTLNLADETGIIRTIYGGQRKKTKTKQDKTKVSIESIVQIKKDTVIRKTSSKSDTENGEELTNHKKVHRSKISLVKSNMDVEKNKPIELLKSKSCSSMNQDHLNILNYIFGDNIGPFGNQVYCVNYFTVKNDHIDSPSSKTTTKTSRSSMSKSSVKLDNSEKSDTDTKMLIRTCDKDCTKTNCTPSAVSLELPKQFIESIKISECKDIDCLHKQYRKLPAPPDDRILLDLTNLKTKCCKETDNVEAVEKIEEVMGGMIARMKVGDDPCYCECRCDFGFTKKTKYCKICGGYEKVGEDLMPEDPFPCPVFYNLIDKLKTKASITSDTKKSSKAAKSTTEKSIESDKETKKSKKKNKDNKFKFNYGYTAPHIGHDNCTPPFTGTMASVPKKMGWLWTAENVPGIKFRPNWKPGAVNKHVLRLLRRAKTPGEVVLKKQRRRGAANVKRPLKRPLLVVHKKDGEYTVALETMKTYSKPRAINQAPYEDKPPTTYTIGRTKEENEARRLKKERAARRLERAQRDFIQSAFTDMCQEICLKTYQQALGILPGAEDPDCPCYPAEPGADKTDLDRSCSCSEDSQLTGSETDSDEWIIEFTPPTAIYDASYKSKKKSNISKSSQYTYLDYRVMLVDRYGNPVPRYFKGPDGREQCSDLGGFRGPNGKWLEINVDGFIGADGKWAPNSFTGPNGEHVDGEEGKFQNADGKWLVIGIDGYVDSNGKWRYYPKTKLVQDFKKQKMPPRKATMTAPGKKKTPLHEKKSEATWSCLGDANPKDLSKLGILGHGHDRKLLLDTLNTLIAQGEDLRIPTPSVIPRSKQQKGKGKPTMKQADFYDADKLKCKHATPSSKGIVAMDGDGNKVYFRFNEFDKKMRPKQRIADLTSQGISVSSFHVPCFHSFINAETMKNELYRRRVALSKKQHTVPKATSTTSPHYRNV